MQQPDPELKGGASQPDSELEGGASNGQLHVAPTVGPGPTDGDQTEGTRSDHVELYSAGQPGIDSLVSTPPRHEDSILSRSQGSLLPRLAVAGALELATLPSVQEDVADEPLSTFPTRPPGGPPTGCDSLMTGRADANADGQAASPAVSQVPSAALPSTPGPNPSHGAAHSHNIPSQSVDSSLSRWAWLGGVFDTIV